MHQSMIDTYQFLRCPICNQSLSLSSNSVICLNHHCFDISKKGYIHLYTGVNRTRGYDKNSFENRKRILDQGFYSHILNRIVQIVNGTERIQTILDVGCGEGFYARQLEARTNKKVMAFDLSKSSIQIASRADTQKKISWFVADLANIPIKDHHIDCILDLYSPANYKEFTRILSRDGLVIKVIPGEHHLQELRSKANPFLKTKHYSNQKVMDHFKDHFTIIKQETLSITWKVSSADLQLYLKMTPLLFHIDTEQIDWSDIKSLTIEAELLIGQICD